MKAKSLWRVSLTVPSEVEEEAAGFLAAQFGTPPASYTDLETGVSTVSLYLEAKPANWLQRQEELSRQLRRKGLVQGIPRGGSAGGATSGGKPPPRPLTLARLRHRDWAEVWKQHFRPIEIARRLLVKPSWSARRGHRGQVVLVLDPGLSFGTGHHPTTEFCLEQVVARRVGRADQSFLDMGTGSGILAMAAAKLGYRPVVAFDYDPEAVRVARANAKANGVQERIRFSRGDVRELSVAPRRRYQLVCANLIANLLLEERDRIVAQVADDGCLVLAGILRDEFEQVINAYQEAGLRLAASRAKKEWRSGAMVWRKAAGRR
ncbi:MAG TPA: 50S ribosomal protein L11 methyltransferase [Verrucomicrobiota bacterium]|jgi:ribosomal protein L11 methyltransferase|nr:50S ribosomal protein L11 methyltransferase [Verrucomicrobiota bacterium]HRT59065.1 50S ribosomal protein L11 methyltransferase [Candidatus Paceibacterota bacterium]